MRACLQGKAKVALYQVRVGVKKQLRQFVNTQFTNTYLITCRKPAKHPKFMEPFFKKKLKRRVNYLVKSYL